MATKRLHDIEIWRKSWFRALSQQSKLLWFYVKDNCNCAGICEIDDLVQISFFMGVKINEKHFNDLKKQLLKIDEKRVLLVDFIEFQYGELHDGHKMYKKILSELAKFGIKYPIDTLLMSPLYSIDRGKDKDTDQDKDLDKEEVKEVKWFDNTEEGYQEYLKISEPAFDNLLKDWSWIEIRKEYFPGCCVKRTLFRMWEEFWGTKAGWENKRNAAKGKQNYQMDWKLTIERNFKKSICYYGKDEKDDEKTQIEIKKKFGEIK